MRSMDGKEVAELVGVVAIVASLVFVGVQLRQAQDIAVAEGYSMLFATRIEVADSIKDHLDIWRRGAAGEELTEDEAAIFAILLTDLNDSYVQGFLHTARVASTDAALWNARDFASFLYRNPGARAVWGKRENELGDYRALLGEGEGEGAGTIWSRSVRDFLAELDRLAPPIDGGSFPSWW